MRVRRPFVLIAAPLLLSSCVLFRPVDPSAPRRRAEPEAPAPRPADAQPAAQPVARPAQTRPAEAPARASDRDWRRERVTDGNLAAMVLAYNNTDISYARLAPSRAEREDIRRYAERMLSDHTGVNARLNELLGRLDLTPVDNGASLAMRDQSADRRDLMYDLAGYKFDSTYIENEITYHREFLAVIDDVLIPFARSDDLRGLITAMRPVVAAHLAHAEQVRADVIAKR